jgi:hypothetical protein
MANKNILLLMLAITLAFGLTLIGCGEDTDDNSYKDSFKGEWTGTFTPNGGEALEATIVFTDSKWTLTAEGISQSGTYSKASLPPNSVNLKISGITIGSATAASVIGIGALQVTFSPLADIYGSGTFSKIESNIQGDFVGAWTGNFTTSGGDEITATITFTDSTWTLGPTTISASGTYEKSSSYSASLKAQGGILIGTAILNPANGTLKVTILPIADHSGSGTFTRQQP